MSRSRKKNPCWSICGSIRTSHLDKTIASRSVRRTNKVVLKVADDYEEYTPLHRLECAHNDVWSWSRDGNQHWHILDKNPYHLEEITIEIDWLTQVERMLDGFPAINKKEPRKRTEKERFQRRMRK